MLKQIINHCMKKVILLKSEYLKVCATWLKPGILYGETEVDEPVEHNFPPLCPNIWFSYVFAPYFKIVNWEFLTVAGYESFFIFDKEYYFPIDGIFMGSLSESTLANAYLCHFEKKWLSECPAEFLPNVYKKNVDEIFVTFDSYTRLLKFVYHMNRQCHSIKITFEVEQNNNFLYLGIRFVEKAIHLSPLFSKTLPLVVYFLILTLLYLYLV